MSPRTVFAIVIVAILGYWLPMSCGLIAQDRPTNAPPPVPPPILDPGTKHAPPVPPPVVDPPQKPPIIDPGTLTVSDQDQQTMGQLQFRIGMQMEAVAVLQKEVDSTSAEISRLVQRLQKPGFLLLRETSGRLLYTPIVASEPAKAEVKK